MIGKTIYKCCYSCTACSPTKQTCQRKNISIDNIYEITSCKEYDEYPLWTCCICGEHLRNLAPHVKLKHGLTMSQYKVVLAKNKDRKKGRINVWDR